MSELASLDPLPRTGRGWVALAAIAVLVAAAHPHAAALGEDGPHAA